MNENLYIAHKKLSHKTLRVHSARYTQRIHVSSRKLKLPKDTHTKKYTAPTHTHTHTNTHTHTHKHTHTSTHTQAHTHMHTHTNMHARTHARMQTHTHTHKHAHTHMHTHCSYVEVEVYGSEG